MVPPIPPANKTYSIQQGESRLDLQMGHERGNRSSFGYSETNVLVFREGFKVQHEEGEVHPYIEVWWLKLFSDGGREGTLQGRGGVKG